MIALMWPLWMGAGRPAAASLGLAIWLCAASALPAPAYSSLSCGPTQLGAPCADGGPATLARPNGPGLGVGNPVNLASGNKYQRETEMPALPGILGLELVRHYNSFDTRTGPFGVGWTLSYDTRLYRVGNSLQIVQADGSRIHFSLGVDGMQCVADDPAHGTLRVLPAGGYVWKWRDGRSLAFDSQGRLDAIVAASGAAVSIVRGGVPGHASYRQILRVTDPAGRSLFVRYAADGRRVAHIDTPAGTVAYRYTQGLLQAAVYPDGHWRGYLYEAQYQAGGAARLTGIVAGGPGSAGRRLNSWIYDPQGRVVRATLGAPDSQLGRLDIAYGQAGGEAAGSLTTVRDADGGETRFHIAIKGGRHVVLRVDGAGCAGCARPGQAAQYDEHGTVSQAEGQDMVRDELARIVRFGPEGQIHVQWWGQTSVPRRISKPSIVAGRRHMLDIEWQPMGGRLPRDPWADPLPSPQGVSDRVTPDRVALDRVAPDRAVSPVLLPVAIIESGWQPVVSPDKADQTEARIDEQGVARPISRRMRLHWRQEAGRVSLHDVTADAPITVAPLARVANSGQGWPGLAYAMDDFGNMLHWRSNATGSERRHYDERNRLHVRRYANGGEWHYRYDGQGRLVHVQTLGARPPAGSGAADAASEDARHSVDLAWRDKVPVRVANGFETQELVYDGAAYLSGQRIRRPQGRGAVLPGSPGGAFEYAERFERDPSGRVLRHILPEGGILFYHWGDGPQLLGISWQDSAGRLVPLLRSQGQGYVQSNGVRMRQALRDGRLAALAYLDGQEPLWAQTLQYDAAGRIVLEHTRQAMTQAQASAYAYDAQSRLIATPQAWFAWQADGALARQRRVGVPAAPQASGFEAPAIQRDASGLPLRVGKRVLRYGANRRLIQVSEGNAVLAHYRHNALGERIVREGRDGLTHYLYSAGKVVAEWRRAGTDEGGVVRRYVYAHDVPVALIEYAQPQGFAAVSLTSRQDAVAGGASSAGGEALAAQVRKALEPLPPRARVYAVHSDAVGLPRLASDEARRVRWQANYSVFGQATVKPASIELPLRLPGQLLDPDTGWHDNYLRTYDPASGHYLEPDPLGPDVLLPPVPGLPPGLRPLTSAFGYAAQQPRRYADPLGLVLFAFDGTRESAVTASNVYQMALLYRNEADMAAGRPDILYQPGPGNADSPDLDAAVAGSADAILATQWRELLQHLAAYQSGSDAATIDLVGYSRGAALARQFANQLAGATRNGRFWQWDAGQGAVTACVELRFMGLFDSVAQFGLLGSRNHEYDFSIAPNWRQVAHAVALHERRALFPLLSTANDAGQLPGNVIEQAFVGAHGDIGGGLAQAGPQATQSHDLSDVALGWMLDQARRAGLAFDTPQVAQQIVSDPVLHDMRSQSQRAAQRLNETYGPGVAWPRSDRGVVSATDTELARYQDDHVQYGRQARAEVEAFIHWVADWTQTSSPVVASVDMQAYAAWLEAR